MSLKNSLSFVFLFCVSPLFVSAKALENDDFLSKIKAADNVNYLCIDDSIPSIKMALSLLNQNSLCKPVVTMPLTSLDGIDSISEIVSKTFDNPTVASAIKDYESDRYSSKSAFVSAFLPTISLSSTSAYNSTFPYTQKTSTNTSSYFEGDFISSAWSESQVTSDDQNYNIILSLSMPIFQPSNIKEWNALTSFQKAQSYTSTADIHDQIRDTFTNVIGLWIAKKSIFLNRLNVIAATETLTSTVAQYQLGSLAIPDIASSLATLRQNQADLSNQYTNFFTNFNSLAYQLGTDPSSLVLSPAFYSHDFMEIFYDYDVSLSPEIVNLAVTKDNLIYYNLYQSSYYNDISKKYLANYLPAITLNLANSWYTSASNSTSKNCTANCIIESKSYSFTSYSEPSLYLSANWSFFDSGANLFSSLSNKKSAEASLQTAVAQALDVVNEISSDIENLALQSDTLDFSNSALKASRQSYKDTVIAYQAGFADTNTLVSRLNTFTSARLSVLSDLSDVFSTKLSIMSILKDGVQSDSNLLNVQYDQDISSKVILSD